MKLASDDGFITFEVDGADAVKCDLFRLNDAIVTAAQGLPEGATPAESFAAFVAACAAFGLTVANSYVATQVQRAVFAKVEAVSKNQ